MLCHRTGCWSRGPGNINAGKNWPYFFLRERAHLAGAAGLLATAENEAQRLREFFPKASVRALPLGLTGEAKPDYERARAQLGWVRG